MNKLNTGLLAIMLMSVGFAASAANGSDNKSPRHHMRARHNVIYSVTQQTTNPNETLQKLANDAPKAADGKRYMVKMTIVEVPDFNQIKRGSTQQSTNAVTPPAPAVAQ